VALFISFDHFCRNYFVELKNVGQIIKGWLRHCVWPQIGRSIKIAVILIFAQQYPSKTSKVCSERINNFLQTKFFQYNSNA